MKAGTLNLEFTQRDDYSLQITFTDSAGVAIDYHLNTFTAFIKGEGDLSEARQFVMTTTSLASGILTITLANDKTFDLPERCVWELRMKDASNNETTMLRGKAKVAEKVRA